MKHLEYGLSQETKEETLDRLRCIEGHIRGIEKMVDGDAGSLEVVHQMSAVQGALDKVNSLIVREYLDNWLENIDSPGGRMDEVEASAKLELLLTLVRIAQQAPAGEGVSVL